MHKLRESLTDGNINLKIQGKSKIFAIFLFFISTGPMATFPILLNSIVHIVMYGYYYLTSLGGEVSQKINKFKKYITIMQMVSVISAMTWYV